MSWRTVVLPDDRYGVEMLASERIDDRIGNVGEAEQVLRCGVVGRERRLGCSS
jgi:hypothetical protein